MRACYPGPQRLKGFPDIPPYQELGYPRLNRPAWYGMIVRSDTPDDAVKRLNTALNKASSRLKP
ncbi:tripartite tricarboxylate transporter substrate-binding protein [Cupriavidus basilensis]